MNAVDRAVLHLECGHNLLGGDWLEEGNAPPTHDYCPGCGLNVRVVSIDTYSDEEAAL